MSRILFYVQHLLGVGHQTRAAAIARAMGAAGLDVTYVTGGFENLSLDLGGATLVQLPPTRATDASFKTLVDDTGHPIDAAWERHRCALLLEIFQKTAPDAVLIEGYPFARRRFRFELIPLLKSAKARNTPVAVSVRDILEQKKNPKRIQETVDIVKTYCAAVLVHGDPALIAFNETFPAADAIADKIHYTGYISSSPPSAPSIHREGVIVSVGGGAVGTALVRTALAARPLTQFRDAPWRIITGPNFPKADRLDLLATKDGELERSRLGNGAPNGVTPGRVIPGRMIPNGVTIETFNTDFRNLLARSALSISQAGYNTIMDLLATRIPAVLAPFSREGETEQTLRAELLAQKAGFVIVPEADLTPSRLARAIDTFALNPALAPLSQRAQIQSAIAMTGASETAQRMVDLVALKP